MDFLFWGGPGVSFLGYGSCMEPTPGPRGSSTMIYGRILENYMKNMPKICLKWAQNGPFELSAGLGSIGNEFAASISSR